MRQERCLGQSMAEHRLFGATPNFKSTSGSISGLVGSITGTASYSEAPTIRYQPVLGSALVTQVATPLSATSLANFLNANSPLVMVLALAGNRLTTGFNDNAAALNALVALDQLGAISFAATETAQKRGGGGTALGILANNYAPQISLSGGSPDSITVYFEGTKVRSCDGNPKEAQEKAKADARQLWNRLLLIYNRTNTNAITLSMKGTTKKAPDLIANSALDIMRKLGDHYTIIEDTKVIKRILATRVDAEKNRRSNHLKCINDFYIRDFAKERQNSNERAALPEYLMDRYRNGELIATAIAPDKQPDGNGQRETQLLSHRAFLLIAKTDEPPAGAYVSVLYKGHWHSILDEDDISKRTLSLVHQFNIVQSVPATTPPLTPSISVGAR